MKEQGIESQEPEVWSNASGADARPRKGEARTNSQQTMYLVFWVVEVLVFILNGCTPMVLVFSSGTFLDSLAFSLLRFIAAFLVFSSMS